MSDVKTTWRVDWLTTDGKWIREGHRDTVAQAVALRDRMVANWWAEVLETRIVRIETREFVEEVSG